MCVLCLPALATRLAGVEPCPQEIKGFCFLCSVFVGPFTMELQFSSRSPARVDQVTYRKLSNNIPEKSLSNPNGPRNVPRIQILTSWDESTDVENG